MITAVLALVMLFSAPTSETGATATDLSGHGNNGTLKGGVTRVDGEYKFHRYGLDHHFDRIVVPDSPSLNPGTAPFTFGATIRVKPTARWMNSEMDILRHGDSGYPGGNYKMELRKTSTGVAATCVIHDGSNGHTYIRSNLGVTLNDGNWHRLRCGRLDATTVFLSIDKKQTTRQVTGLGSVTGQAPLMIGTQWNSDFTSLREQFVGRMDNIEVRTGS